MNRILAASVWLLLLCALTFSCEDLGEGVNANGGWAIYRLNDPGLKSSDIRNTPLTELSLAAAPIVTAADIRSYDWRTHTFDCKAGASGILDSISLHSGSVFGVPFVVTVDRKPIYLGSFWWAYSSLMPWCPYIELTFPQGYTARTIELPPLHQGTDPRSDLRIYHALNASGVLINGIME